LQGPGHCLPFLHSAPGREGLKSTFVYHRKLYLTWNSWKQLFISRGLECYQLSYQRDAVSYFFLHKKYLKKNKNFKILGFSAKLYPRILGLAATPDLRVIFIILIIKLNLHDPSLSESGCNTGPKNTGCGSGFKVVS